MKLWFGSFQQLAEGKYHLHHDMGFNGVREVHFLKSEWESFKPAKYISTNYLIYRIINMVILGMGLFFSLGCCANNFKFHGDAPDLNLYLIFLTHWAIITQTLYSVVYVIFLVWRKCTYRPEQEPPLPGISASQFRMADPDESISKMLQLRLHRSNSAMDIRSVHSNIVAYCHKNENKYKLHSHTRPYLNIEHSEEIHVPVFEYESGRKIVVLNLPLSCKFIWFLFNCTTIFPVFVTLGFWGFVFKTDNVDEYLHFWCEFPATSFVHGFNVVVFAVDFMVVAIPYRLGHFVQVCVFGYLYAIFSGLYEVSGGTYRYPGKPYIYGFLNWRERPGAALTATYVALGFATVIYALNTIVYSFRLWLVSKCKVGARHEHEYQFDWISKPKTRGRGYCKWFKQCLNCCATLPPSQEPRLHHHHRKTDSSQTPLEAEILVTTAKKDAMQNEESILELVELELKNVSIADPQTAK